MITLREAAEAVMEQLKGGWVSESDPVAQDLKAALAEPEQKSKYIQHGWLCPACGAGNSPINMRCGCKGWPKMEITC